MIIGIMGAMPDEVDQLCARLENVTKENYAGVEYHCGTLQGKQVVVCCAGMGKANAASTVQVLCTKYGIDKLIFSGIAGNMTSKIGIGDVCVGETVVYHDAELSMIAQSAPFQTEYHGDPALVQAALGKVGMEQNADMRKISAAVALLAVPTTIAAIFLPTVGHYGYASMFLFWAACTFAFFLIAAFWLPETKGKTLEQIEAHFR